MDLLKRIEELEKRVATLEGQVQKHPERTIANAKRLIEVAMEKDDYSTDFGKPKLKTVKRRR